MNEKKEHGQSVLFFMRDMSSEVLLAYALPAP